MNTRFTTRYGSMLLAVGILVPGLRAWADPLPGEVLKFSQLPLGGSPNSPFPGHDELSTATLSPASGQYTGTFAADDFADTFSTPVVHLDWWGSYLQDPNNAPVTQFLISFESDVPAGPNGNISTPGKVLASEVVTPGASPTAPGHFTQAAVAGGSTAEPLFLYNAELATPFAEQPNTVYWLKIVALTNPGDGILWGWHNRDYTQMDPFASVAPQVNPGEVNIGTAANPIWHFQDDAVTGAITYFPAIASTGAEGILQESQFARLSYNPSTDGIGVAGAAPISEDLAFNLYTVVPEPGSLGVLAGVGLLLRRHRRS
jgi:hypothetical protein